MSTDLKRSFATNRQRFRVGGRRTRPFRRPAAGAILYSHGTRRDDGGGVRRTESPSEEAWIDRCQAARTRPLRLFWGNGAAPPSGKPRLGVRPAPPRPRSFSPAPLP